MEENVEENSEEINSRVPKIKTGRNRKRICSLKERMRRPYDFNKVYSPLHFNSVKLF